MNFNIYYIVYIGERYYFIKLSKHLSITIQNRVINKTARFATFQKITHNMKTKIAN